jgi:DNA-binding winged helix-turn-helix (wHTH) protein
MMGETENYEFDGFRLSIRPGPDGPPEIKLYFEETPQILTQQESRTLQILVRKQGEYVETRALAEEVCGVEQADENIIHVAIRGLRRVFRDPVKGGRYIQNERRKGYRFVRPIERVRGERPGEETPTPSEAAEPSDETLQTGVAAPEDLKEQVISFRELWRSAGGLMRWVVGLGVVLTLTLSAVMVVREWGKINVGAPAPAQQLVEEAQRSQNLILAWVSFPQLLMLLLALGYVLPGPDGLDEDFGRAAGYENPREGDDARYIAEKALGRYTIYWRGILAFWFLLYFCLVFVGPAGSGSDAPPVRDILTTLFNNLGTAAFVLCYNILNQPVEIKAGRREIRDTPWVLSSVVFVVALLLVEVFAWKFSPSEVERERLLYACGLVSGVVGAIGMALFMGRLQSKFFGPSPWLVIALYSYTAIQPLFIFLVNVPSSKQVFDAATVTLIAVVLVNVALILKCMLYLYVALLFKSGGLLFYFVQVRRTYLNVDKERREFRKFLRWEG